MNINSGEARLVLLCPAWRKYGTPRTVKPDNRDPAQPGRRRGAVRRQRGVGPEQQPARPGPGRSWQRSPAGRPGTAWRGRKKGVGGDVYRRAKKRMEGWLGPALLRYFQQAPDRLYA